MASSPSVEAEDEEYMRKLETIRDIRYKNIKII